MFGLSLGRRSHKFTELKFQLDNESNVFAICNFKDGTTPEEAKCFAEMVYLLTTGELNHVINYAIQESHCDAGKVAAAILDNISQEDEDDCELHPVISPSQVMNGGNINGQG